MKKITACVCLFFCLLFASLSILFVIPFDHAPSKAAIENAISWANSLEGKAWFPIYTEVGSSASSPSYYKCGTFAANAYGGVFYYSAYLVWTTSDQHPMDWKAPRGSLVFFDRTKENILGHVALSTGNGNIIQAGYSEIHTSTILGESNHARYLGWAWPPSGWRGRMFGPSTLYLLCLIAAACISGCFFILFLIKPRKRIEESKSDPFGGDKDKKA